MMAGPACYGGPGIQGSGVMSSETRQVEPFTRVEIRGGADIDASIGQQQPIKIDAEDNILPLIETSVRGDTLVISSKENYSTHKGVKLHIVVPSLQGIKVVGAADVKASGLKESKVEIDVQGSGNIKLDGATDELAVGVSGSGDVDTRQLIARRANVNISGSGDVKVNAAESLNASVSGSGAIRYSGNPQQVSKNISGSGSVTPQ